MMTFIRFIVFLIIMNGYFMLLNKKFAVNKSLAIPVTFLLLMIVLFFGGILNMLQIFVGLITVGSLISYIYLIKNKLITKQYLKEYFDYKYILFLGILIILFFVVGNFKLTHYDNFSHWALIVKNMLTNHSLGSFEYNIDQFTSYPRGSALFIYYFCRIVGNSEGMMMLGNLVLNLGVLSSIMIMFPKDKNKIISCVMYVLSTVVFLVINNAVDCLLVDTLLGLLGIMSLVVCLLFKDDIKTCFKYLSIISIALALTKNFGIYFIALNCLLLLIVSIYNKKLKQGIKYSLLMLLMVVGIFVIWRSHLLQVYPGDYGTTTKHSLSYDNALTNLTDKGLGKIKEILSVFIPQLYNIKNICCQYICILNLALFASFLVITKSVKKTLLGLLSVDLIYLSYFAFLGLGYIFSMPYEEAIVLACYDRYMLTIIVTIVGILFMSIYYILTNNIKFGYIPVILCVLFCVFVIYINRSNVLLNNQKSYKNSAAYEAYNISQEINLDEYRPYTKMFVINSERASWDFYYYALMYYYFDTNILVYSQYWDINNLAEGTIVVVPDEDNEILGNENLKYLEDNIYRIEKANS